MPVADTEAHSLTVRAATAPYSCSNRDRSATHYYAPYRIIFEGGWFRLGSKKIENTLSKECRYDRSLVDPRCAECRDKGSGEDYAAKIIASS